MHRLSFFIVFLLGYIAVFAQSPHGDELQIDCAKCHDPSGWKIDFSKLQFDHDSTAFKLEGTHTQIDCKLCHPTLIFNEAPMECISCHADIHSMSVGNDCVRCHTPESWLVDNIPELHEENGFPLIGSHSSLSCVDCHFSETMLRFDRIGNECINCHKVDYETAQSPNHVEGGFSLNCIECHDPNGFGWNTSLTSHDFFPLTLGHDIADCKECHVSGNYSDASPECVSCHENTFMATLNPNHNGIGISNDCVTCHTTEPGWMPAAFPNHNDYHPLNGAHAIIANNCVECHKGDYNNTPNTCFDCHSEEYNNTSDPIHESSGFGTNCLECHTETAWEPATFDHDSDFPIYSGAHEGEWSACVECHPNPSNYQEFTCITCHEEGETQTQHTEENVDGYIYESTACLACHPAGDAEGVFNHNSTSFPLTSGHSGVDCIECHGDGFIGTSMICNDCHNADFLSTANPNHNAIGISTDCITCHTTDPGWMPAAFPDHNDYHPLNGAHAIIANNCAECHNGDYNNTANTCVGCHQSDYDNTNDPNHAGAGFPTDCIECHTETAWEPATFDHDSDFPIYSGTHEGEWSACVECHPNPSNYQVFTCTTCHQEGETQTVHDEENVDGYIYESTACLACHPTGDAEGVFNHNSTSFPLTEGHSGVDCIECHASGYIGTSMVCNDCHNSTFMATSNPNHNSIGISTDCASCHTTAPGWMPSNFDNHNDFYQLNGAHASISNNCAECHNGNYNNTPNTCVGCHQSDYNSANNPDHSAAQFPTDCIECHNENVWNPSTFDHSGFNIYSGDHDNEWDNCTQCHTNPSNYAQYTCWECHNQSVMDNIDDHQASSAYAAGNCTQCHN